METRKISFIGGGRITKIFLTALKSKKISFQLVSVMDTNPDVLKALSIAFPEIKTETSLSDSILNADYIFLAVHPPMIAESLEKAKATINPNSTLISLAPKFTLEKMSALLGGFNRIVRFIPLASSIIGKGYNPAVFSKSIENDTKKHLMDLFENFGHTLEVAENKLEGYAMIVAMGPTYLWFQYYKLIELAKSFGMDDQEAVDAVKNMLSATTETMFNSGLDKVGVIDLIPVKPIGEHEAEILKMYDEKLNGLFQKIKP
ncbi:MAG: pyrroline-5-carboxylate reductase [Bacteroidales bacterium]|nr:MAG: pyrroline-5-carboxylate reductase [Bacteroidales bacterium]